MSNFKATKIWDGTNTAAVKPASTAPIATDPAVVIAVSPNSSVAVTGTFWQTTQPVSLASSVAVTGTFWPTTQPVSGSVSVSNFPATQPVSLASTTITGSVAVTGTFFQATQPISAASLPLPTGASTSAKQPALGTAGSASADVLTVQGIAGGTAQPVSGTFWQTTQPVSLASTTVTGSVAVTGTFWQATQPVSIAATVVTQDLHDGPVTAGAAATKSGLAGAVYSSTVPVLTNTQQVANQCDTTGGLYVVVDGRKASYRYVGPLGSFSAGGSIFTLQGSASKVIRIKRVLLGIAPLPGTETVNIIQLTGGRIAAAPTGGTIGVANTICKMSTIDAAPAANPVVWSAPASQPTMQIATILVASSGSTTTPTPSSTVESNFGIGGTKTMELNGTTEWFCIQLNAINGIVGCYIFYVIEWSED